MSIPRLTLENYDSVTPAVQRAALETAVAEIARLTNKLNADSQNFQIECQKAEIARLTAQRDRLAAEVKAWRQAWRRCDIIIHPDGKKAIDSTIGTSLNHINTAQRAVDHNNDLGGAE